jgi:hypothetical protein
MQASAHHRSSIDQVTEQSDAAIRQAATHSEWRWAKVHAFDLTACSCTALEYFYRDCKDCAFDIGIADVISGRAVAG